MKQRQKLKPKLQKQKIKISKLTSQIKMADLHFVNNAICYIWNMVFINAPSLISIERRNVVVVVHASTKLKFEKHIKKLIDLPRSYWDHTYQTSMIFWFVEKVDRNGIRGRIVRVSAITFVLLSLSCVCQFRAWSVLC